MWGGDETYHRMGITIALGNMQKMLYCIMYVTLHVFASASASSYLRGVTTSTSTVITAELGNTNGNYHC